MEKKIIEGDKVEERIISILSELDQEEKVFFLRKAIKVVNRKGRVPDFPIKSG